MHQPGHKNRKLLAILLTLTLFTAATTAATINNADGNNVVWLETTDDFKTVDHKEFSFKCSGNHTATQATVDGKNFSLNEENYLTTEDFNQKFGAGKQEKTMNLTCQATSPNATTQYREKEVVFRSLKASIKSDGKGFVNGKLEKDENGGFGDREEASLKITSLDGSRDAEYMRDHLKEWSKSNFKFDTRNLKLNQGDVEHLTKSNNYDFSEGYSHFELTPSVKGFINSVVELEIVDEDGNTIYETESGNNLKPKIYKWSTASVKGAIEENSIRYRNLRGKYYYSIKALFKGETPQQRNLKPSNFRLTVEKYDKNDDNRLKNWLPLEDKVKEEKWFEITNSNPQGEYVIEITEKGYNELSKKLEKGNTYRFTLEIKKETEGMFSSNLFENNKGEFTVDKVRVVYPEKSSFKGRVIDSDGNGVRTNITLVDDTPESIETQRDGSYNRQIEKKVYSSMNLAFRDQNNPYPDSVLVTKGADLREKSNLGVAGSAIRYDYRKGSNIEIPGVDPIGMFATKVAYDLKSADSIKTYYTGPHPSAVSVYECEAWSFPADECISNSSWQKVPENRLSKNWFTPYSLNIEDLPLYSPEGTEKDKNILMSAYVIGTAADLKMDGAISISGPRNGEIPKNSEVTVSGRVKTEKDNYVEGVPVDVIFSKPGYEKTLNATTNINGKFEATGISPKEPGEYSIKVKAKPDRYNGFTEKFENELKVYTKKGISISAPRNPEITEQETKGYEIKVTNTGQEKVENVELNVDSFNSDFYNLTDESLGSINPEGSATSTMNIWIPRNYYTGGNFPSFTVSAEGEIGSESFTDSQDVTLVVNQVSETNSSNDKKTGSKEGSQKPDEGGTSFMPSEIPGKSAVKATGEFIASQSTTNLVLGLVMLVMMVVAAAVNRKDSSGGRNGRGRPGNRPVGGSPPGGVTPTKLSPEEDEVSEENGRFDTDEGRELYKELTDSE